MPSALYANADQRPGERLEREIRSKTSGLIRGLHVSVADGQVTITGEAETYYAKQLCTHAALESSDKIRIRNAVEVR